MQSNVFTVGDRPLGTKLMFPYVRGEDGSVTDTLIMSFRTRRVVYKYMSKKAPTFREEMNCGKHICTVMP